MLSLGSGTKEGDGVSLTLLHSPPGKDLVLVSPWDNRAIVPSFAGKADNFVRLVVIQRGDRAILESNDGLAALTARINKRNSAMTSRKTESAEDPMAALNAVAKFYGVAPGELDKQIRDWGAKTTDPYDAGLAPLYALRPHRVD